MTTEIDRREWEQFCERLQESCEGSLVTIELQNFDGRTILITSDVPLRRIALDDESDPCNTLLLFEAGLPNEKAIRHTVVEPIHIRLVPSGEAGRYTRLEIPAENGATVVTLHPGIAEEALRGFELESSRR